MRLPSRHERGNNLNWNWEPRTWKKSTKLLLGLVTIWPPVYMVLFFLSIFSFMILIPFAASEQTSSCGDLDVLQLDQKIKNGDIKKLTLKRSEIVALDRTGNCEFRVFTSNEESRQTILRDSREVVNGRPRVETVEENTSARETELPIAFPIGFMVLFAAHFLTIILMMGLMPLYIILAVKDERHDQTARIIWVVLFCTVGMFAMIVYWCLYVWKAQRPPDAPLSNPL